MESKRIIESKAKEEEKYEFERKLKSSGRVHCFDFIVKNKEKDFVEFTLC